MKKVSVSLMPTVRLLATATVLAGLSHAVSAAPMQASSGASVDFELEILTAIPSGSTAFDLNNRLQVVGQFGLPLSKGGSGEAFLFENGQVTAFQFPGAVSSIATSINDEGGIFGTCLSASTGLISGIYIDPAGNSVVINFPGAVGTQVLGGNNRGDAVGVFFDATGFPQAFMRTNQGVFSTITPPGSIAAIAIGINDLGVVSGDSIDSMFTFRGFVLENGVFTTIDVPGSMSSDAARMNNRGDIVGTFSDFDGGAFGQGYIRTNAGIFHDLTFPDPTSLTQMSGISDNGRHLVGSAFFEDESSVSFMWHRVVN